MQKQKGPGGGNVHGEAELTPLLQYQRKCVPEHIPSQKGKMEKRKSELKMMEEFGEDEFYAHLQNGRIEWRKNPWTPGVYNYRDIGQRKHSEDHKGCQSHVGSRTGMKQGCGLLHPAAMS